MSRKNAFTAQERKTASAIMKFRKDLKFTRVQFGKLVGVDSSRVIRIELGRSPWRQSELTQFGTFVRDWVRQTLETCERTMREIDAAK